MSVGIDRVAPAASPGARSVRSAPTYVALAQQIGITAVAVVLFIVFSVRAENFLTVSNLLDVLRLVSFTAIVGVAMTFLFIAGEFDISVGSTFGLTAVVMAELVSSSGVDIWAAAFCAVALGTCIGLINGLVTTRLGVPSFIVTLGMLSLLRGLALVISGGFPPELPSDAKSRFFSVANGTVLGIPAQVLWMVGFIVVGILVLRTTTFGAHVYATGGNVVAARASGINTRRIKLVCFVLTGASAGLIGALETGWLKTAPPTTGGGFELEVIGAVVIGGVALYGGEGSVFGTFIGAAILGMLDNGIVLLGVQANWTQVVIGAIIVVAASLDVMIRRGGKLASVLGVGSEAIRARRPAGRPEPAAATPAQAEPRTKVGGAPSSKEESR
jgi:ribose transport system permease protein